MERDKYKGDVEKTLEYAKSIIQIEDEYDFSMKGHFIDKVLFNYLSLKTPEVHELILNITKSIKNKKETFGDYTVTKVKSSTKFKGKFLEFIDSFSYEAYHFRCECGSEEESFLLVEITAENKIFKHEFKEYLVYYYPEDPIKVNIDKLIKNGRPISDRRFVYRFSVGERIKGEYEVKVPSRHSIILFEKIWDTFLNLGRVNRYIE